MIITLKKTPYRGVTKHHGLLIWVIVIASIITIFVPKDSIIHLLAFFLWIEFIVVSNDLYKKQGYERGSDMATDAAISAFTKSLNRLNNNLKTVEEWAMELPADLRKKFLKNVAKEDLEQEHEYLSSAILCTFSWNNTPEGRDFWQAVYSNYYLKDHPEEDSIACAKEVPDSVSPVHKCRKHGIEYTTKRCNRCQKEYDAKRKAKKIFTRLGISNDEPISPKKKK